MSTVASYFDHSESTGYKKDDQGAGRICLVEERKAAGCAIRNLLVKQGYQIDYYDAMEAALAALQSQPFDLLITDLHLNDSSAHWDDLIRRVRIEHEQTRQFLPILVLTSDAEADTLARVFRAGANDFVAMPARAHELCARVEHLIRLHHTLQSLTRQTQIPKLVGTVCYVHPAQSPYANLVQKLGKIGLRVDHYQCADEAFRAVVDNDYSFVITDLELFHEGMNGDDLAHAIRTLQNERFHNLAVVLVIDCEKKATLEGKNYAEVDAYFLTSATEVEISSKLQKLIPSRSAKEPQKQTVVTNVHPHRSNKLNQSYPGANPVNHLRMETRDPIGQVAENFQPRSKKTREDYKAVVRSEYKRIINWIIQHPWLNLLIMMIVLLATSSGVKNIELVADYRIFFGDDNPELIAFDKIENTYAKNFSIMFVATPKNGDVFTNETLKIIYELTAAGWLAPFASRVDSITNFQHSWSQGDELVVADLVDSPGELSYDRLAWIRQIALAEPLLVNRLVSPQGHVTGVNVTVQLPGKTQMESEQVADYGHELKRRFLAKYPNIELHLTGLVMQETAFYDATLNDIKTLMPAMAVFVIILVAFILRSISAMIAVTFVIGASSLTAIGAAGWMGIDLSAVPSIAPTIILTLAVANSIHILSIFFYRYNHGISKADALYESLRLNLQPVFLTTITTTIGFLSMNFSDAPPFHDLGNIVAMGVLAAFMYSIVLLPAVILLLPVKVNQNANTLHMMMQRLGNFVVYHRGKLIASIGVAFPILAVGTLAIEVDDNFVEYFDERYEFRTDADYVQKNLTGLANIEFSVHAANPGGINDPVYLQALDHFAQWLTEQPGVVHVNTIASVMKRLNSNMNHNDPAHYLLPKERDTAAQYLLLLELSLPRGLDLNNQINLDKSASRVTVTLDNLSNNQQLALEESASNWLHEHAPAYMHAQGASPTLMFAHISNRNIRSMFTGTFFALLLISAILVIALRSVRVGIISILPNLIPAIMAFGVWGILVGKVGVAISVVSAMALGIIVDDTVHFLSKYLSIRREKALSASQAIQLTFVQVGPALVTTSVILVGGFMVLALSGFSVNADMGMLTAITLAIALIVDLLFLPPLLIWIEQVSGARYKRKTICETLFSSLRMAKAVFKA